MFSVCDEYMADSSGVLNSKRILVYYFYYFISTCARNSKSSMVWLQIYNAVCNLRVHLIMYPTMHHARLPLPIPWQINRGYQHLFELVFTQTSKSQFFYFIPKYNNLYPRWNLDFAELNTVMWKYSTLREMLQHTA